MEKGPLTLYPCVYVHTFEGRQFLYLSLQTDVVSRRSAVLVVFADVWTSELQPIDNSRECSNGSHARLLEGEDTPTFQGSAFSLSILLSYFLLNLACTPVWALGTVNNLPRL